MNQIYLDHNATTPIDPEAADFMVPFLRGNFGNPSSAHMCGIDARLAVEAARNSLALMLNCSRSEIIFTGNCTESDNIAVAGMAYALKDKGNHIITTQIEHPAVLEVCRHLERSGFEVSYLPVNSEGVLLTETLEAAIRPETILVSIMHANNETGSIQNIAALAAAAKSHGIVFHTDAAQSAGKIPTDVKALGVDLMSIAGHKFYGPKGVGALYIRTGLKPDKILHGAGHECNIRPGTENVLCVAGLGKAAEIAHRDLADSAGVMRQTRDRLYQEIIREIPSAVWNGNGAQVLPNTLSISFPGIDSGALLLEMDEIAASAGAACHSDNVVVSHVLTAMKLDLPRAKGTIRLSTGKFTTIDEVCRAASIITSTVKRFS